MACDGETLGARAPVAIVTRGLRRVHRWAWIVLAIALPLVLAIALGGRREAPPGQELPGAGGEAPASR